MSWTPPPSDAVPPGFKPSGDPNAAGTTFTHPDTGQDIHWGGTQWVNDATGGPFTHAYDMFSGTTAYQDPTTGTWDVHMPPPEFHVDFNVPPDALGYHWIDKDGRRVHFSPGSKAWIDDATGKALPPTTEERPQTGDDAGRVDVPDVDEGPLPLTPEEDSPEDALAKNSIASSRLMALQHGNFKVPHGTVARDYAADVANLQASVALRQQMINEGAASIEIAIVDRHIADLLKYLKLWKTKAGAVAVNNEAQIDDLAAQIGIMTKIVEEGLQTAGGETGGHVGKFIQAKGIGGGGSQTVVPKHRTAKSYLDKPGTTGQQPSNVGTQATADTLAIPTEAPVRAGSETQDLGGAKGPAKGSPKGDTLKGDTAAGRPTSGQLEDAQAEALARQDAASRALEKAEQRQIRDNIKKHYKDALANPDNTLYGREPGQSSEAAAARHAREHSLDSTKYDPAGAAVNITAKHRELEQITTGTSSTLAANQKNLEGMYKDFKAVQEAVREGQAKFPDYWERMDADTRRMLREGLEAARGKDLQYWQKKLDATLANPPAPKPVKPDTTLRVDTAPNLPTEASEGKTRIKGGTSALLAGSLIVVVFIAIAGANLLSQKPAGQPGSSSVAAASGDTPADSVSAVGGGGQAACAPAQFLATLLANATQAVLDEVCTRQMVDRTGDRTEYDGSAAVVKPTVGDMKSIADPEVTLTADDAAALAKDCHVLDFGAPAPTTPAGPIGPGRWCTSTAPAAGTYEVYVVELSSPVASDPDGHWEAGVGFTVGTTATWDSSPGDPLTGHNRYVTIRFGANADAYGPFMGAWSGKQGEFFADQPTGAFAAIDGAFIAVFVPAADWAVASACRWFTYYGRSDNSGGAVDLWPDAGTPEADC